MAHFEMSDEEFNATLQAQAEWAVTLLTAEKMNGFLFCLSTYEMGIDELTGEPTGNSIYLNILKNFPGGEEGRKALEELGRLKAQEQRIVLAAFMAAEAWAAVWAAGKPRPFKQVRDDPKKEEIIAISGMTVDSRLNHGRIDFSRDPQGYIVPGAVHLLPYGSPSAKEMNNSLLASFYKGYFSVIEMNVRAVRADQTHYKYN